MEDKMFGIKVKFVKIASVFLALLCLLVAVKTISAVRGYRFIGSDNQQVATITVTGEGEVSAVPDIAELSVTVMAQAKEVKTAQDQAAKKANAVIDYLKKAGIADRDLKSSYYLNPQYSSSATVCPEYYPAVGAPEIAIYPGRPCMPIPGPQTITGYEVRQTITLTARDLDKVGEIVAGVGRLGAGEINGPYFRIEDEDDLRFEARAEAIADAKAKAKKLAGDLDVRLVRVVSFYENGGPIYYAKEAVMGMGGDMAPAPTVPNIPSGENKIMSNVSITYEIR